MTITVRFLGIKKIDQPICEVLKMHSSVLDTFKYLIRAKCRNSKIARAASRGSNETFL